MSTFWKNRPEGGRRFALWLIRGIARYGGRLIGRALLYPITVYFLVVRGAERRASVCYLSRVLGRPACWLDVARHFHMFASTILDRVYLLCGQMERFRIDLCGVEQLSVYLDRGCGLLIFGSHLGSFEALRALARTHPHAKLRIVLDKAHNRVTSELLDALNPALAEGIIDAGMDSTAIVIAIKTAVEEGAMVALLVDRASQRDTLLPMMFLGGTAGFPTSPWLIAAVLKVPVVLAFGLYHGSNHYELIFEAFSEGLDVPRRQRAPVLAALIGDYTARLERYTRYAPYNWFNFYDFWNISEADDASYLGVDVDIAVQRRTVAGYRSK